MNREGKKELCIVSASAFYRQRRKVIQREREKFTPPPPPMILEKANLKILGSSNVRHH